MEQPLDQFELVIKVKYGDTLRRIGAYVQGQSIDHNMSKLRAKIITLFKLNHDADLILTYSDEDGDIVTLDNDSELQDAVINQRLNPLRIDIQLKSHSSSNAKSPMPGPLKSIPEILANVLTDVFSIVQKSTPCTKLDEFMKSEPFKIAMSNLHKDVEKDAVLSPALAPVMKHFSKLVDPNVADEKKTTNELILEETELPSNATGSINAGLEKDGCNTRPSSIDVNSDDLKNSSSFSDNFRALVSIANRGPESMKEDKPLEITGVDFKTNNPSTIRLESCAFPAMDTQVQSPLPIGFNSHFEFGAPRVYDSPLLPRFTRYFQNEDTSRAFHEGVQCDGCGMHPIVGPRFKSKVKDDHDLCHICVMQSANMSDYMRIDHAPHCDRAYSSQLFPLSNVLHSYGVRPPTTKLESRFVRDVTFLDGTVIAPSTHFTKIWRMHNNGNVPWPFGTQLVWVGGDEFGDQMPTVLEIPSSGFPVDEELDIAVDFTAPSRPGRHVSYWRLVSPSGQKFGQRVWVLIQVDHPQPTSAAINTTRFQTINLNLPPENNVQNGSVTIDINAKPLDLGFPEAFVNEDFPSAPLLDASNDKPSTSHLNLYPMIDFPEMPTVVDDGKNIVEETIDNNVKPLDQGFPETFVNEDFPSAPLLDASSDKPSTSHSNPYPLIDFPEIPTVVDDGKNTVEETLLNELESMGFEQIDLNKEILRRNEYDLEQSVEDLCDYAVWGSLLYELREMGFYDKELNNKVLLMNGGSMEGAVLDLISEKTFD